MSYGGYPSYSELLADYIEESGMLIGEIVKKMSEEKGVQIDRSYISMLKNNKTKNPASDEVNRALAEITGRDPERLIYAAYVEKAPQEFKSYLAMLGDVDFLLNRFAKFYFQHLHTNELLINNASIDEKLIKILENTQPLSLEEKVEILHVLVEDAKERNLDPINVYKTYAFKDFNDSEYKKMRKDELKQKLDVLSVRENEFWAPFRKEIKDFTKTNNGPLKLTTTPKNVLYLFTEMESQHEEFKQLLLPFIDEAYRRYVTGAFEFPSINKNVILKLDTWLEGGNITFKGIELTGSDKSIITMYIETLLKERLNQ